MSEQSALSQNPQELDHTGTFDDLLAEVAMTYPLAGWLGSAAGLVPTLFALAALALIAAGFAVSLWPAADPDVVRHEHADLASNHPHLKGQEQTHAHVFVIDDLHARWP